MEMLPDFEAESRYIMAMRWSMSCSIMEECCETSRHLARAAGRKTLGQVALYFGTMLRYRVASPCLECLTHPLGAEVGRTAGFPTGSRWGKAVPGGVRRS
jgi:hypothetical protein